MFCNYCGKKIPDDSAFCPACGMKLPDIDMPAVTQTEDQYCGTEQTEDHYDDTEQAGTDWKTNLLKGKLTCPDCKSGNLLEARYCFCCGRKFTDKEQEAAYNMTIYGKIEKAEKIQSIVDGSIITGSTWFRVIVIAVIAAVGLWGFFNKGSNFRVAESDGYEVQYNTEEKKYYLLTDHDSINVALYVPKNTEELELTAVNTVTDEVLETKTYSIGEGIALYPDSTVKYLVSTGKQELTMYALRK